MARTTVYAVRDTETGERLSYRYRDKKEAIDCMAYVARNSGKSKNLEVYRTTQDLPRVERKGWN